MTGRQNGFIEITDKFGKLLLINVDSIESIEDHSEETGGTIIFSRGHDAFYCYSTYLPYEKVKDALQEFGRIVRVKA